MHTSNHLKTIKQPISKRLNGVGLVKGKVEQETFAHIYIKKKFFKLFFFKIKD